MTEADALAELSKADERFQVFLPPLQLSPEELERFTVCRRFLARDRAGKARKLRLRPPAEYTTEWLGMAVQELQDEFSRITP
jgi:hypothetical protein